MLTERNMNVQTGKKDAKSERGGARGIGEDAEDRAGVVGSTGARSDERRSGPGPLPGVQVSRD